MYVRTQHSTDEHVREYHPARDLWNRIQRRWRREKIERSFARYSDTRPDGLEPFSDDRSPFEGGVVERCPEADVLHLHWISGFVDLPSFFERVSVPVVWTLHDMNPFTGGCHYDRGCGRFVDACGACPQLGSSAEDDLSRAIWQRKREAFSAIPPEQLHVVATSRWMAEEARRSSLLDSFEVSRIPLGLDVETFAPRDGEGLRRALGIPEKAKVLLFVAHSTENKRKGFGLLTEALKEADERISDLFLLSVGGGHPDFPSSLEHLHLGHVDSDRLLSAVYSSADAFVIPSTQEAFGQTALESIACGTPVIGFDAGGIPDIVRPGQTGLLAKTGEVESLRAAIEKMFSNAERRVEMGERARSVAVEEYALDVQTERYVKLYRDLINARN
jgi:glycosyltransferase involved in cell wall biosynthesis